MYKLVEYTDSERNRLLARPHLQIIKTSLDNLSTGGSDTIMSNNVIYERNFIINLAFECGKAERINPSNSLYSGDLLKQIRCADTKIWNCLSQINPSLKKHNDTFGNLTISLSPDFLIHESNSYDPDGCYNTEDQHVVIEAKTTEKLSERMFFWDFCKLNVYLDELHFDVAIYYIMRTKLLTIEKHLNSYFGKEEPYTSKRFQDILFFVQEKINGDIKIYHIIKN